MGSVPVALRMHLGVLGMLLQDSTQRFRNAGAAGEHPSPAQEEKPLFPPLPAPPGSLAARSLLRLPAEASHATRSSYDNAES